MKTAISTGLRVAAWSAAGLLAMGTAATTANAVTHHADNGPGVGGPGPGQGIVHGTAVVKVNGKYKTVKQQRGTVTDINSEALVVTSSDEYAATYVITSNTKVEENCKTGTLADIADGDSITVTAKKVDGKFRAVVISEGKAKSSS
jgi:hypothetical protein